MSMERVGILSFKVIPRRLQAIMRDGQLESDGVSILRQDLHLSRNKIASCASPGMQAVHPAGVPYAALATRARDGTGDVTPVDLRARETLSAPSICCTPSPSVQWCPFRSASRIYVQSISDGVVAQAQADVVAESQVSNTTPEPAWVLSRNGPRLVRWG